MHSENAKIPDYEKLDNVARSLLDFAFENANPFKTLGKARIDRERVFCIAYTNVGLLYVAEPQEAAVTDCFDFTEFDPGGGQYTEVSFIAVKHGLEGKAVLFIEIERDGRAELLAISDCNDGGLHLEKYVGNTSHPEELPDNHSWIAELFDWVNTGWDEGEAA